MEAAIVAIEEGGGEGGRSGEAQRSRDSDPDSGVAFERGPLGKLNLVDGHRFPPRPKKSAALTAKRASTRNSCCCQRGSTGLAAPT